MIKNHSGEWGWGIVREFETDMYRLLYLEWITNWDLLCSVLQGTLLNVKWQRGWERVLGEVNICMCMAGLLCCPPETIKILLITYSLV